MFDSKHKIINTKQEIHTFRETANILRGNSNRLKRKGNTLSKSASSKEKRMEHYHILCSATWAQDTFKTIVEKIWVSEFTWLFRRTENEFLFAFALIYLFPGLVFPTLDASSHPDTYIKARISFQINQFFWIWSLFIYLQFYATYKSNSKYGEIRCDFYIIKG